MNDPAKQAAAKIITEGQEDRREAEQIICEAYAPHMDLMRRMADVVPCETHYCDCVEHTKPGGCGCDNCNLYAEYQRLTGSEEPHEQTDD